MLKYIHSDGRRLAVRDISEELWAAEAFGVPLPIVTHQILNDSIAKELVKSVKSSNLYVCKNLKGT